MPREGTKAARIMALYSRGDFTDREIADAVGCNPVYVRVVARQRKGSGTSIYDRKYVASPAGQIRRAGSAAYNRALRKTGSHEKARRAYAKAVKEAAHA